MTIAILATGDELTHGDVVNTTSQVFASQLSAAGFPMGMHLVCGDKHQEILEGISFVSAHHQTIILSGGLGPTSDDRTRFALADFLSIELVQHDEVLEYIKQRLSNHKVAMDEGQVQQALLPEGATLFPNANGTAYGCAFEHKTKYYVMLPGPPKECMPMFEDYALPYLNSVLEPSDKVCLKWRLQNVPEGPMAKQIETALEGIRCSVGYRAEKPYLEIKVRCKKSTSDTVKRLVQPLVNTHLVD